MSKNNDTEFNPVKEEVGGKKAQKVIWTTKIINIALNAIQQGKQLKVSPFYMKNTMLLKPELVYRRTKEEIDDYIHCKKDPVYFASKCFLMTPEGLQACKLRDYQEDYLRHLQLNRFSIFLSCRQSGKCFSYLSSIKIFVKNLSQNNGELEKLFPFYIKDNIYELPFFELYNLYCQQTLIWKVKYQLYKMIYKLIHKHNKMY